MPAAARGNSTDSVQSKTGVGASCNSPQTTATNECSSDVFVNTIGAVRKGDKVALHPASGCGPDQSTLTKSSGTVFVNGKGAGRKGDEYTSDNTITSGSGNVFIGD
jgi:uncharacterized Zn-binding protein involved in type VI secretion